MAHDAEPAIKLLNDLIATCYDAEEGYAKAAKGVHDHEWSGRLASISGERGKFARRLSAVVLQLGGEPATDAHYGGILHSGWVDLETRIRSNSEQDILEACRRGDAGTLKHYQEALDQDLPQEVQIVVERQRKQIEADLNNLSTRGKSQSA
jgi:uncharacterized protein (TIGR02284 family)